jgi:hypothetical protein
MPLTLYTRSAACPAVHSDHRHPCCFNRLSLCAALPQDEDLRQAAAMLQRGLNAPTLAEEEAAWTAVIDAYGRSSAPWADDVVGRALGNRGNARSRQVRQWRCPVHRQCPPPTTSRHGVVTSVSWVCCPAYAAVQGSCWSSAAVQGRLSAALDDYAAAMARCPWSVDPVLNRGVALEALGRWGPGSILHLSVSSSSTYAVSLP